MAGGIALLDGAVLLNPNLASAWFLGGFLRVLHGETDAALEHLAHAVRSSPLDPEMFRMQAGMAMAHYFAGRFDSASAWAEKAAGNLSTFPAAHCLAAASHALAGRMDKATQAMERARTHARSDAARRQSQRLASDHRPEDLARFRGGAAARRTTRVARRIRRQRRLRRVLVHGVGPRGRGQSIRPRCRSYA
jgi:tetratricopeptide (TPR) repeat protein